MRTLMWTLKIVLHTEPMSINHLRHSVFGIPMGTPTCSQDHNHGPLSGVVGLYGVYIIHIFIGICICIYRTGM